MRIVKEPRKSLRGIVLITTLAIMTFMVMLSVMLLTTSHNSLRRAAGYYQSVVAQQAAVAGAVFAQSCLEADLGWMATRRPGVVIGPMRVGNVEVTQDFDKQTVHGVVFPASQGVACVGEFRISFRSGSLFPNDSTPGAYVSCNNMGSDVAGYTYAGTSVFRAVPKRTVNVVVEGLARAMADGTALHTNGTVLARRVVETGFYRDMTGFVSVAASGGNMIADVEPSAGTWTVEMAQGLSGNPGIRSMHDVQLYANDSSQFSSTAGSVHVVNNQGAAYAINPASGARGTSLTPTDSSLSASENAAQFARITFDQVKSTSVQSRISAGTYVYWDSTSSTPTYYPDLSYTPHKDNLSYVFNANDQTISVVDSTTGASTSYAAGGSPTVPSNFWGANMTVNVNAPLDVQAASYKDANNQDATNRNLAIVAAPTVQDRRVSFNFQQASGAVLQNSNDAGSIVLRGDISGSGSVLAKGDIAFEGHSALQSNSSAVVTMYSGGDTVLAPILNVPTSVDTKTTSVASTTTTPTGGPATTGADALAFDPRSTSDPAYDAKVGIVSMASVLANAVGTTGSLTISGDTMDNFSGPASGVVHGTGGLAISPDTFTAADGLTDRVYRASVNGAQGAPSMSSLQDTAYLYYGSRDESAVRRVISGVLQYNLGNWNGTAYMAPPGNIFGRTSFTPYIADPSLVPRVSAPTPSPAATATPAPAATAAPTTTVLSRVVTDSRGVARTITVNDQEFYGMIYACGNFTTQLPHTADVSVRGAIVAFGGDPGNSSSVPGANGTGRMLFQGKNVTFTYDPTYLGGLYNLFPAGRLSRSFYACY